MILKLIMKVVLLNYRYHLNKIKDYSDKSIHHFEEAEKYIDIFLFIKSKLNEQTLFKK